MSFKPVLNRRTGLRYAYRITRALLLLWAGFWTWFVMMHVVIDGWGVLPYAARILVPLLCPVVLSFIWPRVGGLALIGAGVGGWLYLGGGLTTTHAVLTLPAVLLGAVFLVLGWRTASGAGQAAH